MKSIQKIFVLMACFFLLTLTGEPMYGKNVPTDSTISAKAFPLLSLLSQDKDLQKVFETSSLKNISKKHFWRSKKAMKNCTKADCIASAFQWNAAEVKTIGDQLVKAWLEHEKMKRVVANLRDAGNYALYEDLADSSYLRRAWQDAAEGINRIFAVYILGEKPRYGKIDSISFDAQDPGFVKRLRRYFRPLLEQKPNVFFQLPLLLGMKTLELNHRDEAARFEPLYGGVNLSAYEQVRSTNFDKYPYSVILIPGLGPEDPAMRLEPRGAVRCQMGVERWKQGLAPFMVVSGGNVHPFQTPFNEAEEMKKYMVEELGVPENVIFIEPHARHTTTNLRNTSRIVHRFGLPMEKPVLIVTDTSQSKYIVERMAKTAIRDLKYEPYERLKKLSEVETEFYPVRLSLHADPFDPLDP